MNRDEIYKEPINPLPDFKFDSKVVSVFPDMIHRSVPGYATLLNGIALIAKYYVEKEERCYDLGCSLGACSKAILTTLGDGFANLIAVDSSPEMIARAKQDHPQGGIEFVLGDICQYKIQSAKMVVLNLVLQFIPPSQRRDLVQRIHQDMKENGVLVLSEKVPSSTLFENLHLEFKSMQGYTNLEIAQKRNALEAVMKLNPLHEHVELLQNTGFRDVCVWFQVFNWISILAFK